MERSVFERNSSFSAGMLNSPVRAREMEPSKPTRSRMRSRRCFSSSASSDKISLLRGESVIIELRLRRSISIIIPAFNEEKRLPSTLEAVQLFLKRTEWEFAEIVVVDDGSSDRTVEV